MVKGTVSNWLNRMNVFLMLECSTLLQAHNVIPNCPGITSFMNVKSDGDMMSVSGAYFLPLAIAAWSPLLQQYFRNWPLCTMASIIANFFFGCNVNFAFHFFDLMSHNCGVIAEATCTMMWRTIDFSSHYGASTSDNVPWSWFSSCPELPSSQVVAWAVHLAWEKKRVTGVIVGLYYPLFQNCRTMLKLSIFLLEMLKKLNLSFLLYRHTVSSRPQMRKSHSASTAVTIIK